MTASLFTAACLLGGLVALWAALPAGRAWFVRNFNPANRIQRAVTALGSLLVLFLAGWIVAPDHRQWFENVGLIAVAALIGACVAAPSLRIRRAAARQPRRVLAIGAHPDDLELACGATLAKLADAGHEVRTMVMSSGSQGGNSATRRVEAASGSDFMGVSALQLLDFVDTNLSGHGQEMTQAIEAFMEEFQPDLVMTHSPNDYHQDHQAVHNATMRAARRHSSILCFESPSSTRQFDPSVFVDIAGYVDVKIHAVALHRNQKGKPYMSAERVRSLAAFRGAQVKTAYAEGFESVRLLGSDVGEF
ncbi:PIG-L deacetylase family protein [Paenarthrobacter sp. NPDC089316]|uniref:PIG-L deacetylase family protein n=1 Tax=unclassified Paenarthrobacter TaxID=2634190 RepID=UPI00344A490C